MDEGAGQEPRKTEDAALQLPCRLSIAGEAVADQGDEREGAARGLSNVGQGFPVAWLMSSRENTTILTAFLKGLKREMEKAGLEFHQPANFMSDCFEGSYSARVRRTSDSTKMPQKLLCSFHVARAWRAKLNMIKLGYCK